MERIKQNTVLHDAKLEDCKKELQLLGKLTEVNPNYELKYGKPGTRKSPNRRGLEIGGVVPKPVVEFKAVSSRLQKSKSREM